MAHDLFEQLAAHDVPPLPETFDRQVHQRLNSRLLLGHLIEFAGHALPLAFLCFGQSVLALIALTMTGSYPSPPRGGDEAR